MTQQPVQDLEGQAAFSLERLLEQLDRECPLVAQRTFVGAHTLFRQVLDTDLLVKLQERVFAAVPDENDEFTVNWERLSDALNFGEHKLVHDRCSEFLLRHSHLRGHAEADVDLGRAQDLLASCRMNYIEPEEVAVNTFINGQIQFVVSERRGSNGTAARDNGGNGQSTPMRGDPGFSISDALGRRYRCFVKQVPGAKLEEVLKLKITNVTDITIDGDHGPETVLYLEPRIHSGEQVMVRLDSLSYTGNSFTFRLHRYDGFLWFKRRGVNKEMFNAETLHPGDQVVVQVLYTSEQPKWQSGGRLQRLGIIKAIPLHRVERVTVAGPDTVAARIPA